MTAPNIHVVLTAHNGWAVEVEGTDGATSHYPSLLEAVAAGEQKARLDGVELFIHGEDGAVRRHHDFRAKD
ncbi:hypothetical protein BKK79_19020 [Cupriavidus sp. USMAA2-4]|uniref:DUF2188 domain-containing protein n=1 Tax=Cupriavidus malaysiensis TaxID=367825 RepID=A0ABM6F5A7_9BURK|nr:MULTISPECIES: DUF2188 domain-containing protein [Cupriavidus]AOY93662.1 hypothetical protein BKK79_19020 [Cupriavidus sp. USMAA2-4]AOZ00061.1 hypothetical protein BKK81_13055 [Cupriavidus sp. USMAHM13]AOZ06674.1 hypothetical protein BKK80_13270 [Cupriavidus malaysiensis]